MMVDITHSANDSSMQAAIHSGTQTGEEMASISNREQHLTSFILTSEGETLEQGPRRSAWLVS